MNDTETTKQAGADHGLPRLPALDGLRGLALIGVVGFHAGVSWLRGGYLPLTVFFTLSGFLIASILLVEINRTGRIDIRRFWSRRARRLVPAALMGVTIALAYGMFADRSSLGSLRVDAIAALGWVTNWRLVFQGRSYGELFSTPSPLQHFWSLAVEEQFYVVFPVLLTGLLLVSRGRRWVLQLGVGAGAVASTLWMAHLYDPNEGPLRTYYGTDARAAELLAGVLLATFLIGPNGLRRITHRTALRALDGAALAALATTLVLWGVVGQFDAWLFRGGMAGLAVLAVLIVMASTQPETLTARILSASPLAALGRISYGVYVLHWPVFLVLTPERTGLNGLTLLVVRCGVVLGLASISYAFLEQPVRVGRAIRTRIAGVAWANASVGLAALAVLVSGSVSAMPTITLRASDAPLPPPPEVPSSVSISASAPVLVEPPTTTAPTVTTAPASTAATAAKKPVASSPAPTVAAPAATTSTTAPPPPAVKVLVVGDSIGQNIAIGLKRWGAKTGKVIVWDHAIAACPVARGGERRTADGPYPIPAGCDWWGTPAALAEIEKWDPDVILMVGGLNDIWERKVDGWATYRKPGDATFDRWALGEYEHAADLLGTARPFGWMPPPCLEWGPYGPHIEPEDGHARVRRINDIVDNLLRRKPDKVQLADLDAQICPGGEYDRDVFGPNSRPDGLHLSDEAAEILTDKWLGPFVIDMAAAPR